MGGLRPLAVQMRREKGSLGLFPVQLCCSPNHFNENNNRRTADL